MPNSFEQTSYRLQPETLVFHDCEWDRNAVTGTKDILQKYHIEVSVHIPDEYKYLYRTDEKYPKFKDDFLNDTGIVLRTILPVDTTIQNKLCKIAIHTGLYLRSNLDCLASRIRLDPELIEYMFIKGYTHMYETPPINNRSYTEIVLIFGTVRDAIYVEEFNDLPNTLGTLEFSCIEHPSFRYKEKISN